jgi:hypothetical protein
MNDNKNSKRELFECQCMEIQDNLDEELEMKFDEQVRNTVSVISAKAGIHPLFRDFRRAPF